MSEQRAGTTSKALAELVGGRLAGDGDIQITAVASLTEAGANDVSFLGNEKYRCQVVSSAAGTVFVPRDFEPCPPPEGRAWIFCDDPSDAFTRAVALFAPAPVVFPPGCDSEATVRPGVTLPASCHVGARAVIETGAVIGERTVIGAGVYIGHESRIGEDCFIHPNVTIRERSLLGNRVIVHSGTTIGSDGFGYIPGPGGHEKIAQLGIAQIDDDVEIGALVAVDRARFGRTWIKRGTKIDNLVQIAHNVVIGEDCFIIAQVGISGSVTIGDRAILAGQVGVAGHLTIGDGAIVMAQSGVAKDVPAGARLFGSPAMDPREYARKQLAIRNVGKLQSAVKELQRDVAELREKLSATGSA